MGKEFNYLNPYKSPLIDKEMLANYYISMLLSRTISIFEYKGLPETIPQKELEEILQLHGNATIAKTDKGIYALWGNLGGRYNAYYKPTISVVANPYLDFNKTLNLQDEEGKPKDAVVIKNTHYYSPLLPLIQKTAYLLADSDLSIRLGLINSRIIGAFTANNDNTASSLKDYLHDIEEGTKIGVIATDDFVDGLKSADVLSYPSGVSESLKEVIEVRQYVFASFLNEIGIQANYNMKREAINSSESGMNEDSLIPLIDEMLDERQKGIEKVNQLFGTSISVDFSPLWKRIEKEITTPTETRDDSIDSKADESDSKDPTESEVKEGDSNETK